LAWNLLYLNILDNGEVCLPTYLGIKIEMNSNRPDLVTADHIGVVYPRQNGSPQVHALKDCNLRIAKGEFFSIIGPSGCGKTTLLKVLGGLIRQTEGTIHVGGKSPEAAREKRAFGFVFQNPVIFDWRTVTENIKLPKEVFRMPITHSDVQQLVRLVGLEGFEDAYPRHLSGGMKSRVAIARVLSYDPRVLLMDEPFGDLDEITRDHMNVEILRIWEHSQLTIVFVTHSISEAVFLSDRVAVMTPKPSRIRLVVDIDLPRPRTAEVRNDKRFLELSGLLRSELESSF